MACVFTHLQIVLVQWVLRRSRLRRQRLPMKPSGRRFCYCLPCSASTIYGVVRAPAVGTPQQSLSTRSSIPAMLCNPLAERGNVSELKTQLGAVKEAVQKEQVRSGFGVIAHGSCLCSHWRAF